jgi:hypothetical protein
MYHTLLNAYPKRSKSCQFVNGYSSIPDLLFVYIVHYLWYYIDMTFLRNIDLFIYLTTLRQSLYPYRPNVEWRLQGYYELWAGG